MTKLWQFGPNSGTHEISRLFGFKKIMSLRSIYQYFVIKEYIYFSRQGSDHLPRRMGGELACYGRKEGRKEGRGEICFSTFMCLLWHHRLCNKVSEIKLNISKYTQIYCIFDQKKNYN